MIICQCICQIVDVVSVKGAVWCKRTLRSSGRPGSKPSRTASPQPSGTEPRTQRYRSLSPSAHSCPAPGAQCNTGTCVCRRWTGSRPPLRAVWTLRARRRRSLWRGTVRCRRSWPSLGTAAAVTVGNRTRAGPASTWASRSAYSAPGYTGALHCTYSAM